MALDISGASIGFDAQGVNNLMEEIHTEVIDATIKCMQSKSSEIETWVSDAWVGQSADNFVKNLKSFEMEIANALEKAEEGLRSEFNQIQSEIKSADEDLIKDESSFLGRMF